MTTTRYRTVPVPLPSSPGTIEVFFREAGPADAPVLLLLHGFPSSGHMFRDLIPRLADRFRLVAPDLPGFGRTELPPRERFRYRFETLAAVMEGFVDAIGLDRFGIYVFDYGAPVGFRLALRRPERITGIVSQNGNAYEEGLAEGWAPIRRYWEEPSQANREALRRFLTPELVRWQYEHGVPDPLAVSPDGWELDSRYMGRPGAEEAQLDLFGDYRSNVAMYGDFQRFLRERQPPLLAIWGRNDPFFLPAGAEAYRRDVPDAEVRFLDTGHFALETHAAEIARAIRDFLPGGGRNRS